MGIMYVVLIVPLTNRTRSVHIPEQIPCDPGQQIIILMLCNDALDIFLPSVCVSRFHILKAINNIGVDRIEFHFCHIHSPLLKVLAKTQTTLFTGQTSECIPVRTTHPFAILAVCIIALLEPKEFHGTFPVTKVITLIPSVGIRVKMPRNDIGRERILLIKQCRVSNATCQHNQILLFVHFLLHLNIHINRNDKFAHISVIKKIKAPGNNRISQFVPITKPSLIIGTKDKLRVLVVADLVQTVNKLDNFHNISPL
nr:MAG TPA: hypothetical protein [Caudoviricetes sp.]